eukprot:TRINITY_DN11186_c0_g1_i1.p1 TRINITY_DN11186_c0_g1~~TRINITY_DN11186_c0_g1_i1.p1  ORF type:complete len:391 (-),score=59.88 TRINITY_DN11186_c0_g1_i1:340-1512(-)
MCIRDSNRREYTPDTLPVRLPCAEADWKEWRDPMEHNPLDLGLLTVRGSRDAPLEHLISLIGKRLGLSPDQCTVRFAGIGMKQDLPIHRTLTWFGPHAIGLELLLLVDTQAWETALGLQDQLRSASQFNSRGSVNQGLLKACSFDLSVQPRGSSNYLVELCTSRADLMSLTISPHQINARVVRRSNNQTETSHVPLDDRDEDRNFSRLISDLRTVQAIDGDDRKFMLVFRENRQCKHTGFLADSPRERDEIVRQLLWLQAQTIHAEWKVVKTNERGRRQPRVLGVDSQCVYNYKPQEKHTVLGLLGFTPREVERQSRLLSSLVSVKIDNDTPLKFSMCFVENGQEEWLLYEAPSTELCEEIVGQLKRALGCSLAERKLSCDPKLMFDQDM